MSAPVFLAGPGALDGYRPGDSYPPAGAEGRHAGVVLCSAMSERC